MTVPIGADIPVVNQTAEPSAIDRNAPRIAISQPLETVDEAIASSASLLLIGGNSNSAAELALIAQVIGFACDICERHQALPFLRSNSYDAAILDVQEPEADFALLDQTRRACKARQVPIVVLADHHDVNTAFRAGASVALARPVSPDLLRNTLGAIYRLALGQRRQYARYRVEIPLTLTVEDRKMEGKATDLGHGGMALVTADPLPLSALVSVRFLLPGSGEQIVAAGEIRWSDHHGRSGMSFERIAGAGRHALDNWIARRHAGMADLTPRPAPTPVLPPVLVTQAESANDPTQRGSRIVLAAILALFCLFVVGFWIYIAANT